MFIVFNESFESLINTFYFIALLMPIVIGTSYFFNYFLVPNYLLQKKYWRFALHSIYMVIISLYLEMLVIILAYIYLANYKFENMGPIFNEVVFLALALYFVVFVQAFILLVKDIFQKQRFTETLMSENKRNKVNNLQIRVERKNVQIALDDIFYIESLADYVKVVSSTKGNLITKEKISSFPNRLPNQFIRTHRSFIINSHKIDAFSKTEITINNKQIPISRTYKKQVFNYLESMILKKS